MADTVNTIALITKYSPDVYDDVYKKESTSSILSKNSADVQFTGAKTVKVAKRQFGGLHPYQRNNVGDARVSGQTPYGYQSSQAGLTWEDFTISMDRAAYYPIETFDNEESGGKLIGTSISYVAQYILVPEIDAFCWSKIYANAGNKIAKGGTLPETGYDPLAKPFHALNLAFKWENDHEVPENDQIILASTSFYLSLQESTEAGVVRRLDISPEKQNVNFQVASYAGREIVVIPPDRFKTAYDFTGEGFTPTSGASDIDLIVMPKTAATHIVKFQKTHIISGDAATAMTHLDGYVLLCRVYHDVLVFDNRKVAIYAVSGFSASTLADTYSIAINAKGTVTNISQGKGDLFTMFTLNLATAAAAVGVTVPADDVYAHNLAVGTKVADGDKVYLVRPVGGVLKIVAVQAIAAANLGTTVTGTIA